MNGTKSDKRQRHTMVCRGCWTSCTQNSARPLRYQTQSQKGGVHTKRNARRTKRIHELLPVFAFEGDDFTASAANIGVDVKRLPKMINRAWTRHCTDVEQDANIGLEDGAKGIKEPTVGIDLLLVLLFETKDDLDGHNTFLRAFNLVR
jgi:hypothetical protein